MPAGRVKDSVVASPHVRFAPLGDSHTTTGEVPAEVVVGSVVGVDLMDSLAGKKQKTIASVEAHWCLNGGSVAG
jgi:hypothetical protein